MFTLILANSSCNVSVWSSRPPIWVTLSPWRIPRALVHATLCIVVSKCRNISS